MPNVTINVKEIYPSEEGDVVEITSLEEAIYAQMYRAQERNHFYDSEQSALDDLLTNPTITLTTEPVGKTVIGDNHAHSSNT